MGEKPVSTRRATLGDLGHGMLRPCPKSLHFASLNNFYHGLLEHIKLLPNGRKTSHSLLIFSRTPKAEVDRSNSVPGRHRLLADVNPNTMRWAARWLTVTIPAKDRKEPRNRRVARERAGGKMNRRAKVADPGFRLPPPLR